MFWRVLALLSTIFIATDVFCNYNTHNLGKRALIYPQNSIWQFTYGVTAPVILPNRSINFSVCCQLNYEFPYNYSHWFPYMQWGRHSSSEYSGFFDLDRHTFYKHAVQFLEGFGVQGEPCLLRTVCELSEIPLETSRANTLLEKIIHFIFTPSEDYSRHPEYNSNNSFINKLLTAEQVGRTKGSCRDVYYKCEFSLIDLITSKFV